ncbi:MAG: hypothetical protein KBT11_00675, partial [Treponema sp.]|nr:hypothetical protein [Candidatus Treponema equifaecale]
MYLEADRNLKFDFLSFLKREKLDDREVVSNIDDDEENWFHVQVGNNDVGDCFHLEFTTEGTLEFHIESNGYLSKFDCEKAFNYFKKQKEFTAFDFNEGGWSLGTFGYWAIYKTGNENDKWKKSEKAKLLELIKTSLNNIDDI